MKPRIIFVERKPSASVSIERVFRQIALDLPANEFDVSFQNVPFGNGFLAILRNLIWFRKNDADLYHITGDIHYMALVLPADKTVLTIHDLIFLRRRSGFRRYILKKLFLDFPLKRIRYITVVSQAIKDEIILNSGVDPDRISVLSNPLSVGFDPVERPFDQECPTILHIGTSENKNLPNLIAAVSRLNCKLRIIGRLNDKLVNILNAASVSYENLYDLSPEGIVTEYRNADIVSFCSTYEGFGLPIIEAQAMRRPVLTSNIAPMKDVAGSGAILVDPFDVSDIKRGLQRLIEETEVRNRMIAAGLENIKRFDGKNIAEQYATFYRHILK